MPNFLKYTNLNCTLVSISLLKRVLIISISLTSLSSSLGYAGIAHSNNAVRLLFESSKDLFIKTLKPNSEFLAPEKRYKLESLAYLLNSSLVNIGSGEGYFTKMSTFCTCEVDKKDKKLDHCAYVITYYETYYDKSLPGDKETRKRISVYKFDIRTLTDLRPRNMFDTDGMEIIKDSLEKIDSTED